MKTQHRDAANIPPQKKEYVMILAPGDLKNIFHSSEERWKTMIKMPTYQTRIERFFRESNYVLFFFLSFSCADAFILLFYVIWNVLLADWWLRHQQVQFRAGRGKDPKSSKGLQFYTVEPVVCDQPVCKNFLVVKEMWSPKSTLGPAYNE